MPAPGSRKNRGGTKFSVAHYIEDITVSSKVNTIDEGAMMWEKQWLEFAATLAGGNLSDEVAALQWSEWVAMRMASPGCLITDKKGPEHPPLPCPCAYA
eukprot:11218076-Lingulodinium_polyedra.AAC.1